MWTFGEHRCRTTRGTSVACGRGLTDHGHIVDAKDLGEAGWLGRCHLCPEFTVIGRRRHLSNRDVASVVAVGHRSLNPMGDRVGEVRAICPRRCQRSVVGCILSAPARVVRGTAVERQTHYSDQHHEHERGEDEGGSPLLPNDSYLRPRANRTDAHVKHSPLNTCPTCSLVKSRCPPSIQPINGVTSGIRYVTLTAIFLPPTRSPERSGVPSGQVTSIVATVRSGLSVVAITRSLISF